MQEQLDAEADLDQWDTFDVFTEEHDNFSPGQIEWIYRNRETNGMRDVFRKIGKRKYLHKRRFAIALNEGKG